MELDPFAAAIEVRPTFSRTFTDPKQPGRELGLTLRPMDELDTYLALDIMGKAIAKYLPDPDKPDKDPLPFPAVGGQVITLSENLFQNAAFLMVMQCPADERERKSLEFFVALIATFKQAWTDIKAFMQEVDAHGKDAEGERKNDSGEATA